MIVRCLSDPLMKTIELSKTKLNNIYNNMIQRCYNEKCLKNRPSYRGVTVCDEWKNDKYSFYDWVNDGNFYEISGEKTVHLDKDILVKGNSIYSPETCIFVPASVNSMFGGTAKRKDNGLPMGVIQVGELFKPEINGFRDCFKTIAEAWEVYKEHKKAKIITLADSYAGKIPYKLYKAMLDYELDIND
ncbi:hypothetical protein SAMN04487770_1505 [Butyrivibrio sp. ob235]|nr:hypothetical protein SAMN04487770_1505 [Butyrivibrio sp. ob235]